MEQSSFSYIVIFMIIIIVVKLYVDADFFQLKCIVSDVDGNKYCVRERNKLTEAADLLASVNIKLNKIVKHMYSNYPEKKCVQRLKEGFNPKKMYETLPTSEYTAYSENKGEKLAFCLNRRKNGTRLIDENTLTFVALHELSHIMSSTVGHTDEFWQNFKYILTNAIDIGIYKPVDYKKKPQPYCGMDISDNPYYDM
jgi:hypothetical protein